MGERSQGKSKVMSSGNTSVCKKLYNFTNYNSFDFIIVENQKVMVLPPRSTFFALTIASRAATRAAPSAVRS